MAVEGKAIVVTPREPSNAELLIVKADLPQLKVTLVNEEQFKNALVPMVVTEAGMMMPARFDFQKA